MPTPVSGSNAGSYFVRRDRLLLLPCPLRLCLLLPRLHGPVHQHIVPVFVLDARLAVAAWAGTYHVRAD